jgi:hypothetical protein
MVGASCDGTMSARHRFVTLGNRQEDRVPATGLSHEEAARRLARDGPNALPDADARTPLRIALQALREPMLLLLLAAGAIYIALGEARDAMLLLVSIVCGHRPDDRAGVSRRARVAGPARARQSARSRGAGRRYVDRPVAARSWWATACWSKPAIGSPPTRA